MVDPIALLTLYPIAFLGLMSQLGVCTIVLAIKFHPNCTPTAPQSSWNPKELLEMPSASEQLEK